jgi:sphingomyelin phosphodiesterase 2
MVVRQPSRRGHRLTVATLNTRGLPPVGSRLAERYKAIADTFERGAFDVVCLQEVFTYRHLRLLTSRMPSFRYVSYSRSLTGPAGGLMTLSRMRTAGADYHGFRYPSRVADLPPLTRVKAGLKGIIVTRLAEPDVTIVNTHPTANSDGDWSSSNRFYPVHRDQLAYLAQIVKALPIPGIVCGDFNVAGDSALFKGFLSDTGLADAFDRRCPPTFHAAYLSPGRSQHCIDFILVPDSVAVEGNDVLFTDKVPLPSGPAYISDHICLTATISMP